MLTLREPSEYSTATQALYREVQVALELARWKKSARRNRRAFLMASAVAFIQGVALIWMVVK